MFPRRPGRIRGFTYSGLHRYSLTICTKHRQPWFTDSALIDSVLMTIRQCATSSQFALLAYCFMPDHIHLVLCATRADAELQPFVSRCKQLTGFRHRKETGMHLWQDSYYDHVLRDDEETWRAVRYVLENPVRKRLVERFETYPFSGSDVLGLEELRDLWKK